MPRCDLTAQQKLAIVQSVKGRSGKKNEIVYAVAQERKVSESTVWRCLRGEKKLQLMVNHGLGNRTRSITSRGNSEAYKAAKAYLVSIREVNGGVTKNMIRYPLTER